MRTNPSGKSARSLRSLTCHWARDSRLPLGGQRGDILTLILKQGGWLAVTGLAIGFAILFAFAPLVRSLLFDTSARDPLTYLAVGALLLSAALVACVLPARRAMCVDPIVALRYE